MARKDRGSEQEYQTTYAKILEAAYEHFANQGYEGTSLSLIAKEVGISKAALYYYFSSKELLFEALYQHLIQLIEADQGSIEFGDTLESYLEALITVGLLDLEPLRNDPKLARVLRQFDLLGLRQESIRTLTIALELKTQAYHRGLIAQGAQKGYCAEAEVPPISAMFTAALNGLVYGIISGNQSDDASHWAFMVRRMFTR